MVKLNILDSEKENLIKYIQHNLALKQNGYTDITINQIIFSYAVIEGKTSQVLDIGEINKKVIHQNYSHYKIPIVNPYDNLNKYGGLIMHAAINNEIDNIHTISVYQADNGNNFAIKTIGDKNSLTNEISIKKGVGQRPRQ